MAFVAVLQAFQLQEGQPHLGEGQREDEPLPHPVHPFYTTAGALTWPRGAQQAPASPDPFPAFSNSANCMTQSSC